MNTRLGCLVFALVAACGPSAPGSTTPEPLADADGDGTPDPAGGGARAAELQKVIDAEQAQLAELDTRIEAAEGDTAVELGHDRAARASFIAHLRRCQADDAECPPVLDEPSLDQADVKTIAATACSCRTRACADWVFAQVEQWDADEAAAEAVTAARECAHDRIYGY